MCGTVSFKRGDSFYRANKVTIKYMSENRCVAIVKGVEDFHVVIEKDSKKTIISTCTCPSLDSFNKDCQHIAAVLLFIFENQQKVDNSKLVESQTSADLGLSNGLLSLFSEHTNPPLSRAKLHFEDREILDAIFICKPLKIPEGRYLLAIEMKIGTTYVQNIREFLKQVNLGKPSVLSLSFTYDQTLHCFCKETNDVLQKLIQVVRDESIFLEALPKEFTASISNPLLIISPTFWEQLLPLLIKVPLVKVDYDGAMYEGLQFSSDALPLEFKLLENERKEIQLKVEGLNQLIILDSYDLVLHNGKLKQLKGEDCKRLFDLSRMLGESKSNHIPIQNEQIAFFMEKVVPGLKKLGKVQETRLTSKYLNKTPLIAKLYLDRVKNRLLAGLEFHYENRVINPLEGREPLEGSLLFRDNEVEDEILQLMDDSSFIKNDGGYYLHNEELEYEFLYYIVPKLQKLVQLYATTAVRSRIFRGNSHPKIRIKMKKERTNWLEFKFEMNGIQDENIREILVALEEKRKYYRLRNGSLLSLETREFEEINRFLQALPIQNDELENGFTIPINKGIQLLDSVNEHSVFKLEESFQKFLDDLQNIGSLEFQVPSGLDYILRDYQKTGYKWMKTLAHYGFGGVLADDMGLGKSIQSISYILSELSEIRENKLPVLIVCPSSLTYNWSNEFMKFTPEVESIVIDGNRQERIQIHKEIKDIDVIITSYPLLLKDIEWFEKQSFHTVFFDEAQFFKNPVTKTARTVKKIKAKYRFALTGTPIENSIEELWSIFHVVFPELFGNLKDFSNITRKTIAKRISPFLLRRLKEDVLPELPQKMESIETVELQIDQKELYAAYLAKLRHDTMKHLDKDTLRKNRIKILAGLTRLRQICCHPALFVDGYKGSSSKFELLLQIVEEAKISGKRVLIFSQFTKMLGLISRELSDQGIPFFYLDGQTPAEHRVTICNEFNNGERNFFLISLKAGGTGLNLTGADTVILYDIWWNPAVEQQAADRAHRMGQTNVVQVIKLVAKGTIEEKMNELQEKKKHLIQEIMGDEEQMTRSLTEEDIKELLLI